MNLQQIETAITTATHAVNSARGTIGDANLRITALELQPESADEPDRDTSPDLSNWQHWQKLRERYPNQSARHADAMASALNVLGRAEAALTPVRGALATLPTASPPEFTTTLGQRVYAATVAEVAALPLKDLETRFTNALATGDDLLSYCFLLLLPGRLSTSAQAARDAKKVSAPTADGMVSWNDATDPDGPARASLARLLSKAREQFVHPDYVSAREQVRQLRDELSRLKFAAQRRRTVEDGFVFERTHGTGDRNVFVGRDWF